MGQETKVPRPCYQAISGIASQAWMHVDARGRGRGEAGQSGMEEMTAYKEQWPAVTIHPEVQ